MDEEGRDAERLYWTLAEDRPAGALPDLAGSVHPVRRYNVQRPLPQRVMQQVLSEGWAAGAGRRMAFPAADQGRRRA